MIAETTKLTIRLPRQDVEFAKAYAKAHNLSVTEVINRYLRRIRAIEGHTPSMELESIAGLVPRDVDAVAEHRHHLMSKHGA